MLYGNDNRGSVFLNVVVVMAVLSILGLALISIGMADMAQAVRQEKTLEAFYVARSGADAVAAYLLRHPEDIDLFISQGEEEVEIEGNTFVVSVSRQGQDVVIDSTGHVGGQASKVSLSLITGGPVLDMAVFALTSMEFASQSSVYGSAGTNSTQNSSVNFANQATVTGNFYTGAGSNPSKVVKDGGIGNIQGSLMSLTAQRDYNLPDFPIFPSNLPQRGNLIVASQGTACIMQDGQYSKIELGSQSNLLIDVGSGERHIRVSQLIASSQVNITVVGSGKLILYVEQSFKLESQASINKNGDPSKVMLFYKGTSKMDLASQSKYYGSMYIEKAEFELSSQTYIAGSIISGGSKVNISSQGQISNSGGQVVFAPNAHVTLHSQAIFYGSVICKSFEAASQAKVYFDDVNWGGIPLPGNGNGLKKGHWK